MTSWTSLPAPNRLGLEVVRPWLGRPLVSDATFERLLALADQAPRGFGWGCLEVRLDDDPQVDLLFCASRSSRDRDILAAETRERGWGLLEPISCLGSAWLSDGPVHDDMPLLWVEIDRPGEVARPAFAHVRVAPYATQTPWPRALGRRRTFRLLDAGVEAMTGRGVAPIDADLIRRALSFSPGRTLLTHASCATSRKAWNLRFELAMTRSLALPLLRHLEWPGDSSRLREMLSWLPRGGDNIALILECEDGRPGLTVGVEHCIQKTKSPQQSWARFFASLVRRGVCTAEKARELSAWPGIDDVDHADAPWPMSVIRGFDFKLVLDAAGRIRAKAYMMYHPYFSAPVTALGRSPSPLGRALSGT